MYTVHMKRVPATEARRTWFQLLDEAAAGEVIVIERDGKKLHLKLAPEEEEKVMTPIDYSQLIRPLEDLDSADSWTWEWDGQAPGLSLGGLRPR